MAEQVRRSRCLHTRTHAFEVGGAAVRRIGARVLFGVREWGAAEHSTDDRAAAYCGEKPRQHHGGQFAAGPWLRAFLPSVSTADSVLAHSKPTFLRQALR